MPFAEGLFVHSQIRNLFRLAPRQAALHRPFHDPVYLIPAQAQLLAHRFLAGMYPDVVSVVPADDRKVDRGLRIRHKPTPGCPGGLDRRAPHPLSVGGPLVPPAKVLQSLEYVDIVGDLASFNFAMTAAKLATEG